MDPPAVSGATKILGLIADPVVQARSLAAVNTLLARRGDVPMLTAQLPRMLAFMLEQTEVE